MNILVCIKDVPASEQFIAIDDDGEWITVRENTPYRINRFDEYAVEEAIRIKEKIPDTHVDVITLGPDRSLEMIRKAIGMGADNGIHIMDHDTAYKDPGEIASRIAEVAIPQNYDLILTGIMSEDMMNARTGPMLAEILGWPCASGVVKLAIDPNQAGIHVEREMTGGLRDCLDIALPALVTIQAGINKPRYPALSKMLKARKKNIQSISSADPAIQREIGKNISTGVSSPEKSRAGKVLAGTYEEMADQLIEIFKMNNIIS